MRQYLCECQACHKQSNLKFYEEPYPIGEEQFDGMCKYCNKITTHKRVLTRKTQSEMNRLKEEENLRQSITDKCNEYGIQCEFIYQSVVITTPRSTWSFDYHQSKITLYHESTIKINFETGNYSKTHCQFRDRRMKPEEVIKYIASHDKN